MIQIIEKNKKVIHIHIDCESAIVARLSDAVHITRQVYVDGYLYVKEANTAVISGRVTDLYDEKLLIQEINELIKILSR